LLRKWRQKKLMPHSHRIQ
ncbi:hypothetical protein V3C99_006401, partial [Haemonchus contortus]